MISTPHWPKALGKKFPIDLKLDRILEVMERLDNPHLKIPKTIHVAGTNGKGSTTSYISNILRKAGYKVHSYISPHLIEFNERIILNGEAISDHYLFNIFEKVRLACEKGPIISGLNSGLTLFEATTAAAFIAFSKIHADFLVLEVGMGGRLDATNIINQPILSVITSISLDHQEFLGNTEVEIAHEKAGIIKPNVPCVIAKQEDQAIIKVLEYHAILNQSPLYRYNQEYSSKDNDNNFFEYQNLNNEKKIINSTQYPYPSLRGKHQIENASTAIAAIEILNSRKHCEVFYEDICEGLVNTKWPARIEKITKGKIKQMIPDSWEIYLDGAHNAGGANTLARWIKSMPPKTIYLIFGTTRGKNILEYLNELKDLVKFIACVCVYNETNAYLGSEILPHAKKLQIDCIDFTHVPEAIQYIVSKYPQEQNAIILICGSLYLAGDVLKINQGII